MPVDIEVPQLLTKASREELYKQFRERLADDLLKSLINTQHQYPGTISLTEVFEILKKGEF